MMTPEQVLKKYWNYNEFRPGQLEVVHSILEKRDTLALFPTGGGKSICFQVPGMCMDGITLVVSPLIALMKDQVEGLQKNNISAIALHSGMSWKELNLVLDNALKGRYKFIYISPERLASENFKEYLPNLNISLLVVDEAHCISQWGYDFRPSYLRIAECMELLPNVKIAAFTASAPPKVQADICDKLGLKKPFVFIAPFRRDNLHFHAIETENKTGLLQRALQKTSGSAIVFCNTRRETEEISRFLLDKNISADYYHAGLTAALRSRKQDLWMQNQVRVIVCTNAFGMGVDKPDVRYVFHLTPPMFPEAYYQEAGRAGRDGMPSWCLLFYRKQDYFELKERIDTSFPPEKELERVYNAVCNSLGIVHGQGLDRAFEFDLPSICNKYLLPHTMAFYAISNLEILGFWTLSDGFYSPSRLYFCAEYSEVYDFKLRYPKYERAIDILLRSYGGIFDDFVKINEKQIAFRLHIQESELKKLLIDMHRQELVDYAPSTDKPRITFTEPRSPYPQFKMGILDSLKQNRLKGLGTVIDYLDEKNCRSLFWENYYGKTSKKECGHCDLCALRKKHVLNKESIAKWSLEIEKVLKNKSLTRTELLEKMSTKNRFEFREILRWMMDQKRILVDANQKLYWYQ